MKNKRVLVSKQSIPTIIAAALIVTVVVLFQPAAAEQLKLKLGNEGTYPPFSMIGADGKLTGFEPELAREMCKRLNAECDIAAMEFKALLPSLISGKIDMIVSQLYPKPERLEKTEFTTPILTNPHVYIVPKDWSTGTDAGAIAGKRIGLIKGGWEIDALKKHAPRAKLVLYDNLNQIRLDLLAGRLDLNYGPKVGLTISMLDKKGGENWKLLPDDIAGEKAEEAYSWAVQKGNTELRDKVNAVLKEMIEDCAYTKIRKRFISEPTLGMEPEGCQ